MKEKLKFIIANCCQLDKSKIDENAGVNVTENWDSFNHLQIMMCIEKEFSITLDTKAIAGLTSFKDILKFLKKVEDNIIIRDFRDTDKKDVIKLLSGFYPNIKGTEDWQYLYFDNPEGKAVISVVERNNKPGIIGHYSAIKIPMVVFEEKYLCAKGEGEIFDFTGLKELLNENKLVNKNLPAELLKYTIDNALKQNLKLICTNPSNLALKSHINSGFKEIKQDFDIFIFILNHRYLFHLLHKKLNLKIVLKISAWILTKYLHLVYYFKRMFNKNAGVKIKITEYFNTDTDIFMEKFRQSFHCITIERNHRHLNWRFKDCSYKKFIIYIGKQPAGYLVMHIFTNMNGFKEANLVDYLLLPEYWNKFSNIINEVIIAAKTYKCDFLKINYMYDLKEKFNISGQLKKLCFISRTDPRNIVVYLSVAFKHLEARILDINNWFFTDLYFDGY